MFEIYLITALVFLMGICIGSFTNVVIDRLPHKSFFSQSRSHCIECNKTLKWYDIFPVISYILLKGRCRYCRHIISPRILLVELMSGVGYSVIYSLNQSNSLLYLGLFCVIFSLFVTIFFIDAELLVIPDLLLVALIIITIILHVTSGINLMPYFISGLIAALFFFVLFVITKGKGMGFGDVKFAGVIGFLLGFPDVIIALYSAFVIGAIVSIFLILTKRKKLKGSIISFGPFMILGVLVAVLFSDFIINTFF